MSSITSDVEGVKNTFSSWDACMSKAYCKWPAIIGIVIGSIILLSVLWCLFSCLCCGITLCNACVKCITCGNCCGACGRGGGGGRSRHKDDYQPMPPTPQPYGGYQPQPAPMMYNHNQSQFATFDAPTNKAVSRINQDSLPAMPTWENARSQQVEDTSPQPPARAGDVEMGRMQPPQTRGGYNAVPDEPLSPAALDHENPYNSDLGDQRLNRASDGYRDYPHDSRAFSPAPTYATNDPQRDRYNSGMISPRNDPYNQSRVMSPPQHQGPYGAPRAMSPPSHFQRTMSPPTQFQRTMSPPQPTPMPMPMPPRQNSAPYPVDTPSGSTSYEPSHTYEQRSMSPPQQRAFSPYQAFSSSPPREDSSGVRPPSLLQVGRKPVPGSAREI